MQDPPAIARSVSGTHLCSSRQSPQHFSAPGPDPLRGGVRYGMTDEPGKAEPHCRALHPSEGAFGAHLETSLLRMAFGWPRISAAAAAAGPGATNKSEPKKSSGKA